MKLQAFLLACLFVSAGRAADYLSPELRYRVDQLQQSAHTEASTPENILQRIDVLWDWAQAYALTGNPIPQDLPLIVRTARTAEPSGYVNNFAYIPGLVDFYIWELSLKDQSPDAVPRLSLSRTGPIEVLSWQTFEQTITIGSRPMRQGGKILLGKDGFNDQGLLQTADPAGDNYVSIRSSNPRARFEAGPGSAGIALPSRILATFELQGADLRPGETLTVVYGDRSGGSRGMLMQSYTVDQFMLPVYIDLDGKPYGITPAWPSVELIGRPEPLRLSVVAPSIVEPGEAFELSVRTDDRFYNRASGNVPAYQVTLNGRVVREIPAGDNGLAVLPSLTIDQAGVYRFDVRSADGRLAARSNPIWVRQSPPYRVWWGDTHAHSQYAEGQGSPNGFYRFARDDARLDFVTLSEHDIWLDAYEWSQLRELAERYHEPGRFIPILAYEWTSSMARGGHHNVLFRDSDRNVVGSQVSDTLTKLYRALKLQYRPEDVLVIPHAHASGDWTTSDGEVERLIEIASVHGTFEYFGNRYLQNGWQVGFIGSTDNHHGHPGYSDTGATFHTERNGLAAVLSAEKTRGSIFSAMRDIQAYATSGDRIILDVTMDGARLGSRLEMDTPRRIAVRALGTAPIDSIEVIKNGSVAYSRSYASSTATDGVWVQVAFASASEVFSRRSPREYRTWQGTIDVQGAEVAEVVAASFGNQHQEWVRRDEASPNRIRFRTLTRGRSDVLLLRLEGSSTATSLRFDIEPSRISRGGARYEQIPAEQFQLRLGDRRDGRISHAIDLPSADEGQVNADAVRLQVFDPDSAWDQTLEFADRDAASPGDYYYVRVTQIDGERAWSSPFWVGGEPR